MKYLKNSLKLGMVALLLAMFFASCVPYKKMLYLKDAQMVAENQSANYVNERNVDYKLQPGDNLYIRFINTIDERNAAALAGDNTSRTYSTSSDASIYLHSYTLDENGCIELPLTGKIELKNLTVDGAKEKMQTEINKFVTIWKGVCTLKYHFHLFISNQVFLTQIIYI